MVCTMHQKEDLVLKICFYIGLQLLSFFICILGTSPNAFYCSVREFLACDGANLLEEEK